MTGIADLTVFELREAIRAGRITAVEAHESVAVRIEALNPALNAYISTFLEEAREQARAVDAARARGEPLGALAGVPLSIKDNFTTRHGRTTCGSRMLSGYHAPYEATVVTRLQASHALIMGKTNLDEFAMGSTTETSAFGPTRNPWDPSRVPGGSSGGAACAVAAGLCHAALGSDTGGSIRQPAAFCGITGLKPTYGRVSRYGLVAFASSLDQIGPLARDARDAALLLGVIAGRDPRDATSAPDPVPDYLAGLDGFRRGARIGLPAAFAREGCDASVAGALDDTLRVFKRLGAEIVEVDLPSLHHAIACYYIVATAEASSNLARYDGVHYGHRTAARAPEGENATVFLYAQTRAESFGDEVKRRIMLGTHALSSGYYDAYYLKALRVRRRIKEDFDRVFADCHLVLLPASPTPPCALGEKLDDPLAMYLMDIYTVSANLAGIPAISFPAGFSDGLPVGMQLFAPPLGEPALLAACHAFQRETDWHLRRPPAAGEAP